VVFSRRCPTPLWRHPARLWVDPERIPLAVILETIRPVHPAAHCGILGGVAVHDWFAERGLIDAAEITIEPVTFAAGLPLLSGRQGQDPIASLDAVGLRLTSTLRLNAAGTRLCRFARKTPRAGPPTRD
jgi:hypothetical protein